MDQCYLMEPLLLLKDLSCEARREKAIRCGHISILQSGGRSGPHGDG